jgi:cell fate (sporulation/competence/biofilm development) regulator YlbF (YheA/YmcA/DUF963 family)
MITKHLITEILHLKVAVEQHEITISDVKQLIAKPIEELYQMRESLVKKACPYDYVEYDNLY